MIWFCVHFVCDDKRGDVHKEIFGHINITLSVYVCYFDISVYFLLFWVLHGP